MDIPEIDVTQARGLLESGEAVFIDVRDPHAFESLRVRRAIQLNDSNVGAFIAGADKQAALVVYCYHGHSSLGAAAYFLEHGFSRACSLTGGFEAWQLDGAPMEHGLPGQPVGG